MKQICTRPFIGILFSMFCILLANLSLHAQTELRFTVNVSEKHVSPNQPFQVQFIVYGTNNNNPEINIPALKNVRIHDTFTNRQSQVIGGQTLKWIDSYAKVLVVSANTTGKLTIPAASVIINGQTLKTKPVTINVTQTGLASVPEDIEQHNDPVVQDESEILPGENVEEKTKRNFFLRANTNKTVCYVGEPLAVNYKAYSRLNSNSQVVKRPSFPGFSVVEMMETYDNKAEVEVVNGNAYFTNLIRKVQLFPLQPGSYELDPAEIETVIHFVKLVRPGKLNDNDAQSRLQRLFDESVRGNAYRTNVDHYTTLKTPVVKIEVKPLPVENQPADFSGAVGQFTLEVIKPKTAIRQGELISIKWVLSGSGNLQLATLPDIEWPKGIDTSEPSVKEDLNQFVYPLSGKKTFDYAVTARDTGSYVIPPISFSYFDPKTEAYKTIVTEAVSFDVAPSLKKPFFSKDAVNSLIDRPLHLYWFGAVALAIIIWVGYQLFTGNKKTTEPMVQPEPVVVPEPEKIQPAMLFGNARKSLGYDDTKGFHREVQQVLWKIAADRCDVLPSYLNKQNISFELQKQEIPAPVINNFLTVLNECEWALYTPDHVTEDMEELLDKAVAVSEALYRA